MRCQLLLLGVLFALGVAVESADAENKFDADAILESLKNPATFASLDKIIDDNIETIQKSLKDPSNLKDKKHALTKHIYLLLHKGVSTKASQLKRIGPCSVTYKNRTLQFVFNFGWNNLNFDYNYLLQVLFFKRAGHFLGFMTDVKSRILVNVDFRTHQVILQEFKFVDAGKITLKVEGHLGDKILNLVLKAVTWIGKLSVLEKMQQDAAETVQEGIDDLNEILGKRKAQQFTFVNRAIEQFKTDFPQHE